MERREHDAYPRFVEARTPRCYTRARPPALQEPQEHKRLRREAEAAKRALRRTLRGSEEVVKKVVDIDRISTELNAMVGKVQRQQELARLEVDRVLAGVTDFELRVDESRAALEADLFGRLSALVETVAGLASDLQKVQARLHKTRSRVKHQDAEIAGLKTQVEELTRERADAQAPAVAQQVSATPTAVPSEAPPHKKPRVKPTRDTTALRRNGTRTDAPQEPAQEPALPPFPAWPDPEAQMVPTGVRVLRYLLGRPPHEPR